MLSIERKESISWLDMSNRAQNIPLYSNAIEGFAHLPADAVHTRTIKSMADTDFKVLSLL